MLGALNEAYSAIGDAVDEIEIPKEIKTIYHYTDAPGLIGVVQNGAFWASALDKMNDVTEGYHGLNVFGLELNKLVELGFLTDEPLHQFLAAYLTHRFGGDGIIDTNGQASEYSNKAYVACFSELDDDLSQWRAYGANGSGYSIGLDLSEIHRCIDERKLPQTLVTKVLYDKQIQEAVASKALKSFIPRILKLQQEQPLPNSMQVHLPVHFAFEMLLDFIVPIFKNIAFSSEREWRLLISILFD